jgi:predicted RNA binding protein YcfA (HicA-like mRNA interferase family)
MRLSCPGKTSITVPNYKVIGRGLLKKILRDAELSADEFIKLL